MEISTSLPWFTVLESGMNYLSIFNEVIICMILRVSKIKYSAVHTIAIWSGKLIVAKD